MNAQADLNRCWTHVSDGTFSHVEAHFIFNNFEAPVFEWVNKHHLKTLVVKRTRRIFFYVLYSLIFIQVTHFCKYWLT